MFQGMYHTDKSFGLIYSMPISYFLAKLQCLLGKHPLEIWYRIVLVLLVLHTHTETKLVHRSKLFLGTVLIGQTKAGSGVTS